MNRPRRAPSPHTGSPLPAAIYARISRDRAGAGLGVDRQEADARALAERLGWNVVAVYVDNDISAYSGGRRPQYEEMLKAVERGDVRGIVAWHTDRLHRRTAELEEFVTLAEGTGLQVQTVTAGTVDLSSASGRMVARMLGAAAQHEIDHARERMRSAKDQAAKDGKYRGGPRPFGFERDGVTVRESEASQIRDATSALLAGRSLAAIAREWNERGSTGTLGRPWTYNNLRDMLLRPRNAGLIARGLPGRKGRKTEEPDWSFEVDVTGEAAWPAIVDVDEWRALVALLTDPTRRLNASTATRWLGSGIYRCGRDGCGAPLRPAPHGSAKRRPGDRRYLYRCSERAHLTVSAERTDEWVLAVLAELVRDPRIAAAMLPDDSGLSVDRERRAVLTARLFNFEADYAAGSITGAQLRRATDAVQAELAEVDARLTMGLRRAASTSVLDAVDPGAALLASPIDVQRAVLSSVLRVQVQPVAYRGAAWTSERLHLVPLALPEGPETEPVRAESQVV